MDHLTRRQALVALGLGSLSVGCDGGIGSVGCPIGFGVEAADEASRGYLTARPRTSLPEVAPKSGSHHIGLGDGRDGLFYVPEGLTGQVPLVVLLHGAGGTADGIVRRLDAVKIAKELKLAILAPDSRGRTWDVIGGQFGPDVVFLDRALSQEFPSLKRNYDGNLRGRSDELWRFSEFNFAKVAEAMGCAAFRVEQPADIKGALQKAFTLDKPVVVEVISDVNLMAPTAWAPG